jgi:hypothetical protein
MSKPVRYHVVKHTFTVIHEYPVEYDKSARFALEENRCCQNLINELDAAKRVEDEFSICSTCHFHRAHYVGAFDTLEAAEGAGGYDMDPERIRAKLERDDG